MTLFTREYPSEAAAERAWRRRWIVIPGVAVLLCVVVGLVAGLGPWRTRETTSTRMYPAGITKIVLAGAGAVTAVPTSGKQAVAEWDLQWNYRRPAVHETRDGDTMRVWPDCSYSVGVECAADLRLAVPAGVALDITAASGDVRVDGVAAPVQVRSDSGDVNVNDVSSAVRVDAVSADVRLDGIGGDVTANVTSGDLHASGLSGQVARLMSTSGDVEAGFATMPRQVSLGLRSGDAKVEVPPGSGPYRVNPVVRSGDVKIGVRTDPSASSVIDISSMSGDVKVGYGDDDTGRHHHDHGNHGRPPTPPTPPTPTPPTPARPGQPG